jgi:hypothetical protein
MCDCNKAAATIINSEHITACVCEPTSFPFECSRHPGCAKTEHLWKLCRSRPEYHEASQAHCLPVTAVATSGKPPSLLQRAANLAGAAVDFARDGFHLTTAEQQAERLAICSACDRHDGGVCLECGCILAIKVTGRAFSCPLKKWPGDV